MTSRCKGENIEREHYRQKGTRRMRWAEMMGRGNRWANPPNVENMLLGLQGWAIPVHVGA